MPNYPEDLNDWILEKLENKPYRPPKSEEEITTIKQFRDYINSLDPYSENLISTPLLCDEYLESLLHLHKKEHNVTSSLVRLTAQSIRISMNDTKNEKTYYLITDVSSRLMKWCRRNG